MHYWFMSNVATPLRNEKKKKNKIVDYNQCYSTAFCNEFGNKVYKLKFYVALFLVNLQPNARCVYNFEQIYFEGKWSNFCRLNNLNFNLSVTFCLIFFVFSRLFLKLKRLIIINGFIQVVELSIWWKLFFILFYYYIYDFTHMILFLFQYVVLTVTIDQTPGETTYWS